MIKDQMGVVEVTLNTTRTGTLERHPTECSFREKDSAAKSDPSIRLPCIVTNDT